MRRDLKVKAIVLPKITAHSPTTEVPTDPTWRHLSGLHLADPKFGIPARIDILLGTDVFGRAVLHGRRVGPIGSPSAFQTCFGWVLFGTVIPKQDSTNRCLHGGHPPVGNNRFFVRI